jgi:hypothetical protein
MLRPIVATVVLDPADASSAPWVVLCEISIVLTPLAAQEHHGITVKNNGQTLTGTALEFRYQSTRDPHTDRIDP